MTGLFTVTRKLLLLWGGSTFLAIALVGGIFAYSMNTYYGAVADQKIRDGFQEVRGYLISQEDQLGAILRGFVKRSDVQSGVGMISKYQDITQYQPLVFDTEKKQLAKQLSDLTGITGHHFVALYDAQNRLTAYHYEKEDMAQGIEKLGFVTYDNGEPIYMEAHRGKDDAVAVGGLPLILAQAAPTAIVPYVKTMMTAFGDDLLMTLYMPIERQRKTSGMEYLGSIAVIGVIDQTVMGAISNKIGSHLSFALLGGNAQTSPKDWDETAPDLMRGEGAYHRVQSNEGFVGQVTMALDNGEKAGLSIRTDRDQLTTGLATFEKSVLWGLLLFLAVMTPIGLYFINRLIRQPIDALMTGVSALIAGQPVDAIKVDAKDEFGSLAKSFVAMSATIRTREEDLIRHREGLEQTVHERTEKLRETEAKTRQIVNSAVDGIITTDEKGTILSFNTAAEKIFGYSVIEAVGKNVSMLMPANYAARHGDHMARYASGGPAKVIGMGRELIARHKSGKTFLADFSISDFRHGETLTFVGIIRDITQRKEAEYKLQTTLQELQNTQAELVQVEKMASLGGLVAGVAHEINTPIGVGLTAATHLKEQADELAQKFASGQLKKSDFQSFIDTASQSTSMIYANLNRASDLIRSFKQVAVDQTSEEKRQINVLGYVDEVLESLKPNLKRTKHQIAVSGDRDILISTHPGAVSQILTNLVMNSIIHAYDEEDQGHIKIHAERNDKAVSLTYSDDGKGMDEDVCAKIFEPFFTTKRGSGGSGLGMHILYNQVTQTLGGSIDLHSTPGRGTAFEITIPFDTQELQRGETS